MTIHSKACDACGHETKHEIMSIGDRAYFANLLASALTGNPVKLGLSDAGKIKRCGTLAAGDKQLWRDFICMVRCYDEAAFKEIGRYICTVDGAIPNFSQPIDA